MTRSVCVSLTCGDVIEGLGVVGGQMVQGGVEEAKGREPIPKEAVIPEGHHGRNHRGTTHGTQREKESHMVPDIPIMDCWRPTDDIIHTLPMSRSPS